MRATQAVSRMNKLRVINTDGGFESLLLRQVSASLNVLFHTPSHPPTPPAPASAVDAGGSLHECDLRTSGKLQSVIDWRMWKRPQAAVGFSENTSRRCTARAGSQLHSQQLSVSTASGPKSSVRQFWASLQRPAAQYPCSPLARLGFATTSSHEREARQSVKRLQ